MHDDPDDEPTKRREDDDFEPDEPIRLSAREEDAIADGYFGNLLRDR